MKKTLLLICIAASSLCHAQIVNIPDANFKAKLLSAHTTNFIASTSPALYSAFYDNWNGPTSNVVDTNGDGQIQVSEAQAIKCLKIEGAGISNLTGIEAFVNLESLRVTANVITSLSLTQNTALINLRVENNQLTSLTLAPNTALQQLDCSGNHLTSLNVSQSSGLRKLYCQVNELTSLLVPPGNTFEWLNCTTNNLTTLDVSNRTALTYLHCPINPLTTLNVANCPALTFFDAHFDELTTLDLSDSPLLTIIRCEGNNLTSLDISNCTVLQRLECQDNQLTNLDVTPCAALERLWCHNNQITALDVSQCFLLDQLSCYSNNLSLLNLKNGHPQWETLSIGVNVNMQYVCCDAEDVAQVESAMWNAPNCHVNTYCTFTPGGVFYEMTGSATFDYDGNGCGTGDFAYTNLNYTITDGANASNVVANDTGNYYIPVGTGAFTITPTFENPGYFNVSPASITGDFPTQASPAVNNFCVTANGVYHDLEVYIVPVTVARPGFDAEYKIIYKNKGNQMASGSVSLTFSDAVLDHISAVPAFNSQSANAMQWNFAALQPFETREIVLVFNVNGPMETPPVNIGNILHYTASLSTSATDATPGDNAFALHQVVQGAFDPNDKTCLEGLTIAPSMVGKYVHYLIRFENTGTFAAENIVVKDMIDPAKFDVTSLVPLDASHNFMTRIDGNKVEFIFEGINLPFENANNDGYVVFKIKTKPNLVLGNTFSNEANIYFDYNYPVLTDPYVTTVQNALGVDTFDLTEMVVYPNPVVDNLQFQTAEKLSKVAVFDMAGRILLSGSATQNSIDLSSLKTGNYVVKVYLDDAVKYFKIAKK